MTPASGIDQAGRVPLRIIACLVAAVLVTQSAAATTWHVDAGAAPGGRGTGDRPFASIAEARDAIRASRAAENSRGGAHTVLIRGGVYRLDQTLVFDARDGGTEQAPVTYRAAKGAEVIVTGGVRLPGHKLREPDQQEATYLHPDARGSVRVLDLAGQPAAAAFPAGRGDYGMLVYNRHTLQLAQWPNRGFVHLGRVVDMGPTLRWLTQGERPPAYSDEQPAGGRFTLVERTGFKAWQRELARTRDLRQDGYLSNDWAQDGNQVARVSDDGEVQLLDATHYGIGGIRYPGGFADDNAEPSFQPNRRLVFKNLLCELDMPGEWYLDRQEQKLYLWPIDDDPASARILVPGGPALVRAHGAAHLAFEGLVFENGGRLGVEIEGGSHVRLLGCAFRNFTGRAVQISGGRSHGLDACEIVNADSALSITGGGLARLQRCGHFVRNTEIHRLRRRGYGGVGLRGCGIAFENNLVHTMNAAINYEGAYITFKNNEFYNVGWEMGDWNVLYQGADKWCNGNLVENNFFHHMMEEPSRHPIIAARNDDGGTGTTYRSNLFYKTGRGAVSFGGPNCHIQDNIVLECKLVWWTARLPTSEQAIRREYDRIAEQFESGRYRRGGKEDAVYNVERVVGKKGWDRPPWSTAFPNFPKYMNGNPFAQSYGSMLNNYHNRVDPGDPYKSVHIHRHWALPEGRDADPSKPTMADMPDTFRYNAPMPIDMGKAFIDPGTLDFRFKPGFKPVGGFRAFDLERVGLYKSKHRPDPPDPAAYREAIADRFRDVPSSGGAYDPATAYKRYPVQPWLE